MPARIWDAREVGFEHNQSTLFFLCGLLSGIQGQLTAWALTLKGFQFVQTINMSILSS